MERPERADRAAENAEMSEKASWSRFCGAVKNWEEEPTKGEAGGNR